MRGFRHPFPRFTYCKISNPHLGIPRQLSKEIPGVIIIPGSPNVRTMGINFNPILHREKLILLSGI